MKAFLGLEVMSLGRKQALLLPGDAFIKNDKLSFHEDKSSPVKGVHDLSLQVQNIITY